MRRRRHCRRVCHRHWSWRASHRGNSRIVGLTLWQWIAEGHLTIEYTEISRAHGRSVEGEGGVAFTVR